MNQFIASVLGKTSKLHQLIGELQSKYDDGRAAKFLGVHWQRMTSQDNSCKQLTSSKFLAGRKKGLNSAVYAWRASMTSWCSSRPKVNWKDLRGISSYQDLPTISQWTSQIMSNHWCIDVFCSCYKIFGIRLKEEIDNQITATTYVCLNCINTWCFCIMVWVPILCAPRCSSALAQETKIRHPS